MTSQQDPNQQYRDEFMVVHLPMDANRFYANGTWYNVTNFIASGRYAAYQKMQMTFGTEYNIKSLDQLLDNLWNATNNRKDAETAVMLYNAKEGISRILKDKVQCMELCTMFINADNEDARLFNESVCEKKINDWMSEGIDTDFFFVCSARSVVGYIDVYQKYSHTISEKMQSSNL